MQLYIQWATRGGVGQGGCCWYVADPGAQTDIFSTISSRTELIIGASKAKNCEEVDGEVRFPLEPPKVA